MEGALEKLSSTGSSSSELEGVIEQLDSLKDVSHQIVNHSSNISRSTDNIQFIIRKVTLALEELNQDLAKRECLVGRAGRRVC